MKRLLVSRKHVYANIISAADQHEKESSNAEKRWSLPLVTRGLVAANLQTKPLLQR